MSNPDSGGIKVQVVIRAVDVWLFRDGKPFTAGEDHIAESTFPPSPFTLQGAIRTKVLADKGVDLFKFTQLKEPDPDVGYGDNFGKLRLCGPLLMSCENGKWQRLIPMPADIVKVGDRYGLLRPNPNLPFMTNLPRGLQLLWTRTDERVTEAKGWLPESEWKRYLQGQVPKHAVTSDKLFAFEPRFGIVIDASKGTTQKTMLYQARFVRLKDETALWVEVSGVSLSEKGSLRFGGEGRAATYEAISSSLPPLSQFNAARDAKRFKVVLVTPAWFSGGWQPKDGDWSKIFGASVQLVGAAIPRPLLLGGFDVAKGVPKAMRTFVPPGAVYFFEAEKPVSFADDFAFTETPDEVREQNGNANAWAQIGLGAVLIGVW
jgi:CRISPR-associated protein Cmr3